MDRCCASMRPWSGAGHDTTLSVGRPDESVCECVRACAACVRVRVYVRACAYTPLTHTRMRPPRTSIAWLADHD